MSEQHSAEIDVPDLTDLDVLVGIHNGAGGGWSGFHAIAEAIKKSRGAVERWAVQRKMRLPSTGFEAEFARGYEAALDDVLALLRSQQTRILPPGESRP